MLAWPVPYSFRAQIVIVALASLAVIALAGLLIRDVISRTESRLAGEARRQSETACRELVRQHSERTAWGGDALESLPIWAQDLSLRGLAATVLHSYEGLEGGFYRFSEAAVLGHASSSGIPAPLTARERELVASAVHQARAATATVSAPWGRDLLVIVAAPLEGGSGAAWVLKRFSGAPDPLGRGRRWLYAGLALSATLGVAAIISLWLALRSGVTRINAGLSRLEQDFAHRLPCIPGEFGRIAEAVNRMAERRMALEAELRRQDRLAALGKVVAGVAHEIRNPLNSVRLTMELLVRRLEKSSAAGQVQAAIREIDRLDGILTRLLVFGRPAPAERRPQELLPLIEQARRMVREQARRKGVRVELDYRCSGLAAVVDGPQIVQVLINLLLNAIEASPPEGVIELKADISEGALRLSVTDYGPGIPEAVRPHIFDAFFTTRPEGTGLGLSVSREIIAGHGGTLDLDPAGPGTTFRIALPAESTAT